MSESEDRESGARANKANAGDAAKISDVAGGAAQAPTTPAVPLTVWVLGMSSLLTDVSTELIHGLLPNYLVSVLKASFSQVGMIEGLAESLASMLKVFPAQLAIILGGAKKCCLSDTVCQYW